MDTFATRQAHDGSSPWSDPGGGGIVNCSDQLVTNAGSPQTERRAHNVKTILVGRDHVREQLSQLADGLAAGVAVALPWSTSATSTLIVLWLLALIPTLNVAMVRREVETAAGGLPVLLWCFAVVGLLWSDASWAERIGGMGGFHRLLVIPLLLAQFRRSRNGAWVLYGFLASATCVLILSWALVLIPGLSWRGKTVGVPVRDYIFQSAMFLVCALALGPRLNDFIRSRNWKMVLLLSALIMAFFADIAFVAMSRTILVVMPVLAVLLGWRLFRWKGISAACLVAVVAAAVAWFGSSYLRDRVNTSIQELRAYRTADAVNSTALHAEFLRQSVVIIMAAPILGHGTGSIPEQFRRVATGGTGVASIASDNPHNQIFAVAIQLGFVGAVVLLAMWIAHFYLFWRSGIFAWVGTVVVVDNIVSSLFNSHLFDYATAWLYIFGVGVAGGMVLHRDRAADETRPVIPQ
jgi:O-antigen ligase